MSTQFIVNRSRTDFDLVIERIILIHDTLQGDLIPFHLLTKFTKPCDKILFVSEPKPLKIIAN
jgi:hypothetical protein